MSPTRSRTAHYDAKHTQILDAARAVFLAKGFARASIDAIAAAAAVSTATLYRHFQSKEGLFAAVVAAGLASIDEALPDSGDDPMADLARTADAYAVLLASPDTRRLMRMLIAETGDGGAIATAFYDAVKLKLSDRFIAALDAGIVAGCLQDIPTESRAFIAGQLQGMIEHSTLMRGLVLGDAQDLGDHSASEIAAAALDTWLARWRS